MSIYRTIGPLVFCLQRQLAFLMMLLGSIIYTYIYIWPIYSHNSGHTGVVKIWSDLLASASKWQWNILLITLVRSPVTCRLFSRSGNIIQIAFFKL